MDTCVWLCLNTLIHYIYIYKFMCTLTYINLIQYKKNCFILYGPSAPMYITTVGFIPHQIKTKIKPV